MKTKIIVVYEPDTDIREIIAYVLKCEGYTVHVMADCETGQLHALASLKPDLFLLDYKLDGEACTKMCREIKVYYPGAFVIALSCNHNIEQVYHSCGFDACLAKPFDLEDLCSLVRHVISSYAT